MPQINSFRDLNTLVEGFTQRDGQLVFAYSTFSFFDADGVAYFGQSPKRKNSLSLTDIETSLKQIPDEQLYPKAPPGITSVSITSQKDFYIKRPDMKVYEEMVGTDMLTKLILNEAEVLEILKRNPHANIVGYHGCLVKQGRIIGLVLDRYPTTLEDKVKKGVSPLQIKSYMNAIRSAVKHLHSIGLAHNDLNPANIMLDEHDVPFIIDFGSCQPFGKTLISGGTPGWMEEEFRTSEQWHDEIGLKKIKAWMKEEFRTSEQWHDEIGLAEIEALMEKEFRTSKQWHNEIGLDKIKAWMGGQSASYPKEPVVA